MAQKSGTNENDMPPQVETSVDENAQRKSNSQNKSLQPENEGTEETRTNYEEIFENTNQEPGEVF
jgi:hypothetical protein